MQRVPASEFLATCDCPYFRVERRWSISDGGVTEGQRETQGLHKIQKELQPTSHFSAAFEAFIPLIEYIPDRSNRCWIIRSRSRYILARDSADECKLYVGCAILFPKCYTYTFSSTIHITYTVFFFCRSSNSIRGHAYALINFQNIARLFRKDMAKDEPGCFQQLDLLRLKLNQTLQRLLHVLQ